MSTDETESLIDLGNAERRIRLLEEENSRLRQKLSSVAGDPSGGDSRGFFHRVLDALPVGVFIIDAQGRMLETNQAVTEIWGGAPLSQGVNEYRFYQGRWADSGKPIAAEDWAAARAVLKGETSHNEEIHILGFDGRQRTIMNSATPLQDAEGRITGAIAVIRDITKKRKAEEALHESEERFRATFEQAAVGICHVNMQGAVIRTNRKLAEILGYAPEDLVGRTFRDLTCADDMEMAVGQFQKLLAGEIESYNHVKRYIRQDGSLLWANLTVSLMRDKEGAPLYMISVVEDISEKKRTEEALARSERFYKGLFESHHAVMLLIDPETGCIHDANPAACAFYGYSRSEMLLKSIHEINVEPRETLLKKMERARSREEQSFIFMHRLASGEIRHVEVHSGPVEREGRHFLVSIVCDITDRFEAQRERESLLSELNATISSMAEGVLVYSPEGFIVRLNPAAERMLGLSPEDLTLSHAERLKRLRVKDEGGGEITAEESPFSIIRTGGELKGKILVLPSSAGKEIRVSTSAAPVCNEDGEMLGIVCTLTDITELHQLQEQNQTFLHMVSHDLRTPLTVVHGYAELLQMELQEKSENHLHQGAAAIIQCADQMNSMISQMLDMAQLESGSVTLEKEPVLLSEFTEELLRRSASVLEIGRIDVQIGEIPPVDADPRVLERILVNLLTNALKYSQAGSSVTISATVSGNDVVLSVQDRGEGIDSADLPHLFTRYFRTRGARKKEGLGLGLYITRMMTEAHGGRISVESRKGEGSTFKISLPLQRSPEASSFNFLHSVGTGDHSQGATI